MPDNRATQSARPSAVRGSGRSHPADPLSSGRRRIAKASTAQAATQSKDTSAGFLDRREKKRIQNRVAQRTYRARMKHRLEELQGKLDWHQQRLADISNSSSGNEGSNEQGNRTSDGGLQKLPETPPMRTESASIRISPRPIHQEETMVPNDVDLQGTNGQCIDTSEQYGIFRQTYPGQTGAPHEALDNGPSLPDVTDIEQIQPFSSDHVRYPIQNDFTSFTQAQDWPLIEQIGQQRYVADKEFPVLESHSGHTPDFPKTPNQESLSETLLKQPKNHVWADYGQLNIGERLPDSGSIYHAQYATEGVITLSASKPTDGTTTGTSRSAARDSPASNVGPCSPVGKAVNGVTVAVAGGDEGDNNGNDSGQDADSDGDDSQMTLEDEFISILQQMRGAGFSDLESMVSEYYTADVSSDSTISARQRISRKHSLPQVLADLRESMETWTPWESHGCQNEILKSAESIFIEEYNHFLIDSGDLPFASALENDDGDDWPKKPLRTNSSSHVAAKSGSIRFGSAFMMSQIYPTLKKIFQNELPSIWALVNALAMENDAIAPQDRHGPVLAAMTILCYGNQTSSNILSTLLDGCFEDGLWSSNTASISAAGNGLGRSTNH
ncbi:hypothetical protein GJ744_000601 [Endocarpon pusillum]|uniref:BZIP domain-containing protein n=1 Tax=Endocarpon pusillum TaxID=364733 RepID=A0A8H7AD75_9EURO|nr:hypothetical protein GJ744_000601 [Endocarpon pusillum]